MTLFVFGLLFGSFMGLSVLIEELHVPNDSSDRGMCLLLMFVVWGTYQLLLLEWIWRRTQRLQRARNAP